MKVLDYDECIVSIVYEFRLTFQFYLMNYQSLACFFVVKTVTSVAERKINWTGG